MQRPSSCPSPEDGGSDSYAEFPREQLARAALAAARRIAAKRKGR